MIWSCGTGTWQKKSSDHDWQSRCTVRNCQLHGQNKWTETLICARARKDELGNGNMVHVEMQNMNVKDWGIACRH